jgi:hypothetical protein
MGLEELLEMENDLVDYENLLMSAIQVRDRLRKEHGFNPMMPPPIGAAADNAREAMAILGKDLLKKQNSLNERGLYAVAADLKLDDYNVCITVATPIADTTMGGVYYRPFRLSTLGLPIFSQDELEPALSLAMALNLGVFARKEMSRDRLSRR